LRKEPSTKIYTKKKLEKFMKQLCLLYALGFARFAPSPCGGSGSGCGCGCDFRQIFGSFVRFSRISRAFQSDKTEHINTHLKAFFLKTKVSTSRLLISSARHTILSAGAPV
jgi:hypothetical protein